MSTRRFFLVSAQTLVTESSLKPGRTLLLKSPAKIESKSNCDLRLTRRVHLENAGRTRKKSNEEEPPGCWREGERRTAGRPRGGRAFFFCGPLFGVGFCAPCREAPRLQRQRPFSAEHFWPGGYSGREAPRPQSRRGLQWKPGNKSVS